MAPPKPDNNCHAPAQILGPPGRDRTGRVANARVAFLLTGTALQPAKRNQQACADLYLPQAGGWRHGALDVHQRGRNWGPLPQNPVAIQRIMASTRSICFIARTWSTADKATIHDASRTIATLMG